MPDISVANFCHLAQVSMYMIGRCCLFRSIWCYSLTTKE